VFLVLIYAPVLICLPILLIAGILFVLVPGGFIIVLLAGGYFLSVGFVGLVGLAKAGRRQAIHATRRIEASGALAGPGSRSLPTRPSANAATPLAAALKNDQTVSSAPNLLLQGGDLDGVDRLAPADIARARATLSPRRVDVGARLLRRDP
jgi:hypothetical protein